MIRHTDLKKGIQIILQGQPCEVLDASLMFKGRGSSVVQAKIKNLITGNVISQTFRPSDSFEQADLTRTALVFVYVNKEKYVFCQADDKSKRIELSAEQVGAGAKFLKQNQEVEGLTFNNEIINIILPIKVALKVIESPPGIKAGRAESGTKQITLETGAKVNTPLFIKQGDVLEINTQTDEYVRRIN